MSLYLEAARFLLPPSPQSSTNTRSQPEASEAENESAIGGGLSLASRIFSQQKNLRSKPGLIYKTVVETRKWGVVLSAVIESASILDVEKKLSPELALLLTHDLLLSPNGIAAPKSHALVLAITRHKARLSSEFTRARIRAGFASAEAWKAALVANSSNDNEKQRPRWARINTLKTKHDDLFSSSPYSTYTAVSSLEDLYTQKQVYFVDEHIPNLLAFPPSTDVTKTQAYKSGQIILQDKASCIPAYLLDPNSSSGTTQKTNSHRNGIAAKDNTKLSDKDQNGTSTTDGDVIDACAAPGNKTTHLASLLSPSQTTYACERDPGRSKTLRKMLDTASARAHILASTDFLSLSPTDERFRNVTSILLDPSCSGSGMLGRDEDVHVCLPRRKSDISQSKSDSRNFNLKKRKSVVSSGLIDSKNGILPTPLSRQDKNQNINHIEANPALQSRLLGLASLQTRLVLHALSFPAARKVAYSTCSIYAQENEAVVLRVLNSDIARGGGWRVLRRDEQVRGCRSWPHRGVDLSTLRSLIADAKTMSTDAEETLGTESGQILDTYTDSVREGCIRCHKNDGQGTMGFFAVCFIRDDINTNFSQSSKTDNFNQLMHVDTTHESVEDADEWEGFSSEEG